VKIGLTHKKVNRLDYKIFLPKKMGVTRVYSSMTRALQMK
jgi:hypothetical protein